MSRKRHRLVVERLEQRQFLTAALWFVDSGQSLGTNTDGADFGDLDGDGDLDLLVGCRNWPGGPSCSETQVWLNDGRGDFSKGWSIAEVNVGRFALGDLDGDNDLDVYVAKASPEAPDNPTFGQRESYSKVWFNDGKGHFQDSGQQLDTALNDNDSAFAVTLGDVDGDGDLDAFIGNIGQANQIWINTQVIPFSGSVEAVETHVAEEPTLLVSASGSGNASALGRFTVTYNFQVDLSTLTGSGPAHFVAANGDSLFANVTGKADSTENPDVFSITETFAITGGTGRFAGATGSFTLNRLIDTATGATTGSFDGHILLDTTSVLPGDIDNDGEVQFGDFLILANNFGHTDVTRGDGDLNDDRAVDFADFLILANNFGQSRRPVAASSDAATLRTSASATDELFKALGTVPMGEEFLFETSST